MKILVTGATGFVGQNVIPKLIQQNHEVIATSTDIQKAKTFAWYNDVKYIECDYHKEDIDYYRKFDRPEAVIHLAWKGLPNYNAPFHVTDNLPVNSKLLKNFVDNDIRKLVVVGTCYEYGMQNGCLAEDLCTNPVTQYGLAKDTLRKFLEFVTRDTETSFNWVRLFYLYGEGQTNAILPQLDRAIGRGDKIFNMSMGEQLRDYLSIEQATQYLRVITEQRSVDGIINCCLGKPISIRRLIENRIEQRNAKISLNLGYYPYISHEPMAFWGNTTKLKCLIGDKQ